VTLKER